MTDEESTESGGPEKGEAAKTTCEYCGEEYSARGIHAHEEWCDDNPNAPEPDGGGVTGDDSGANGSPGQGQEIAVCPECGNRDDSSGPTIYLSNDAAERRLVDNGPLDEGQRDILHRNEYICSACWSAFSGGNP